MIMKKIFTLIMMLAATLGMQAQDTWTVAGAEALLGENWVGASTVNVMSTSDNGATYTLVKEGIKLRKDTPYEYKIVKNGSEWYGAGENHGDPNYSLTVEENGIYTVTFTFNVAEEKADANAVKTGEAEFADKTWTVTGVSAICGNSWDPTNSANDMTSTDGNIYKFVKTDVVLEVNTNYEFKIVADHAWTEAYPGSNYVFTVAETVNT